MRNDGSSMSPYKDADRIKLGRTVDVPTPADYRLDLGTPGVSGVLDMRPCYAETASEPAT